MANIAVMALGSAGDVNPFLGIAAALAGRGHRVTFITNPFLKRAVDAAGLDFRPLGSAAEFAACLSDPALWDPQRGTDLIFRIAADWSAEGFQRLAGLHQGGLDVIVAPFQCFGARMANEKFGVPLVTVMPNPILVESAYDPVRYPVLQTLAKLGPWGARAMYALVTWSFETTVRARINRGRVAVGLSPLKEISRWAWSPQCMIGLWPAWLRGPQKDWPAQLRLTGFIEHDGPATGASAAFDDAFLARRPIVFTAGSAMTQAHGFFAAAVEAARILDRPALLVTQTRAQLPEVLADNVRHLAFAPFATLLPHCSAIVHHGGIGTAARALRAGIPQLLTPLAHDQFDNAHLLQRIGVADSLVKKQVSGPAIAQKLQALLASPAVRGHCESRARALASQDAAPLTCAMIESLAGRERPPHCA